MDFTLKIYSNLLISFLNQKYNFIRFDNYLNHNLDSTIVNPQSVIIILRHDVDRLPENSLQTAIIEHELGIQGTYYFRVVPESYDLQIMEKIAQLGHEIGYHYEDVDLVVKSKALSVMSKKARHASRITHHLIDAAYESFCKNLEMLRENFDIKTICMHGSPRSKYDNKLIWSKYDYRELGILGEPYFDIDFNEIVYFTDTGRRWNGNKVSVRDKVNSKFNFNFKTTKEIIEHIDELPDKIMFNFHPHRWFDFGILWLRELIFQNIKNVIKYYIIHR
ncbi:hypothetical protein ACX8XP_10715 [Calditrichota bacterium LG25]